MKPFFTYYGGKYRAAPHYPAPQYETIVEPFAGAAGYSLRHYQRKVVLLEKSPRLFGLWHYLINVKPSEILQLPLRFDTVDDLVGFPAEAKDLIGFWLNKGTAFPRKTPSAWMRGGTRPNSYWGEVVRQRIANQVDKIRHWKVLLEGYEAIGEIAEPLTWFVDPPYEKAGTHYTYGSDRIDYAHLGRWCQSLKGQVLVCENDGASWLPFQPWRDIKSNPTTKISKEVLYYSEVP